MCFCLYLHQLWEVILFQISRFRYGMEPEFCSNDYWQMILIPDILVRLRNNKKLP